MRVRARIWEVRKLDEIGEMKEGGEEAAPQPPMAVQTADRKAQRGVAGRIWSGMGFLFSRGNKNDFEKKLQHLTKEEVAVHSRLKRRSQFWRKLARAIIIYSVVGEVGVLFTSHHRFHEGNYHVQNSLQMSCVICEVDRPYLTSPIL